ncbi:MAG: N-glycosylase/DNA lyase [Nanoarchaeota archaeon]
MNRHTELHKRVLDLPEDIIERVQDRLKEFEQKGHKGDRVWFSELCFCILTANSKAETALRIEKELGTRGFCQSCFDDVKNCIISHKHRFHNNKASYIVGARKHLHLKRTLVPIINSEGERAGRRWLVDHIKGIGYKEASHFLRNVGYKNVAILDRHILRMLAEHGFMQEVPQALTPKRYLQVEAIFSGIAQDLSMSLAELDLRIWYLKTGKILK